MSIERQIDRLRERTNTLHALGQGAEHLDHPLDTVAAAVMTSDALLAVLSALEDIDRRLRSSGAERRFR